MAGWRFLASDVHHPLLRSLAASGQPGDGSVVFHAEKNDAALQVQQCGYLRGELIWVTVITLKFDARVLPVGDELEQFRSVHHSETIFPLPRLERFAAALEKLFHETHKQALLPQTFLEANVLKTVKRFL